MRTYEECISCLAGQIRRAAELATPNIYLRAQIVRESLKLIGETGFGDPPPYAVQRVCRLVKKLSGNPDPYDEFKRHFNRVGIEIYPELKKIVEKSNTPFRTAALISLAGNIIDFAPDHQIRLLHTIRKFLNNPPVIDFIPDLERALSRADNVLFVGDNAGETVMDRLLIEFASKKPKYFYAVRGGTVINDATIEDARASGIHRVSSVLSTGSDAPGVIRKDCSKSFLNIFDSSDVVIAKGMGNFETLCDTKTKKIFFMFIAKCELVARHVGCSVGDGIVMKKGEGVALFEPFGGAIDPAEARTQPNVLPQDHEWR
jgi:hypothetical protein